MVPVNFQLVRLAQQPRKLDLSDTNQQRGSTELELDLSDTNQQRGSTDSIQTTSGIAQIFQNPVKDKKGANTK